MAYSEIGSAVALESSRVGLLYLEDLLVVVLQGIALAPRHANVIVYNGLLRPRQDRTNLRRNIQYYSPM